MAWLQERHPHWSSINSLICIDSVRETKDKVTRETRYYISSLKENPQKTLASIRSHWAIENNLHWPTYFFPSAFFATLPKPLVELMNGRIYEKEETPPYRYLLGE